MYDEYPSFNVVNEVRKKLTDLSAKLSDDEVGVAQRIGDNIVNLSTELNYEPLVRYVQDSRDTFLGIFEDNLSANEEAYIKWLTENETTINEEISRIEHYDSGEKGVANKLENSRSELMRLLNMGTFPLFYDTENDYM